ncbi:MAG: hypothetical protein IT436_16295 [Phycisphaerales bacterium]|nr:hypothetical protein [Phycisphaerales bacterium]
MHNALMPETLDHLASRPMRLGHYLWHRSRDVWHRLTPDQQREFKTRFGWEPPPSLTRGGRPIYDHPGPGRDFLYMHREMIRHVNYLQVRHGGQPVRGWPEPPEAGNPHYPVAPEPRGLRGKRDADWAASIEDFRDRWARDDFRSISELGAYVEYGIHAAMHERFCIQPESERLDPPVGGHWPEPGSEWDAIEYDYLLDPYAAHVNPLFWSIHGWIDGLIDAWESRRGPVDWSGAWDGPMHHGPAHCGFHGFTAQEHEHGLLEAARFLTAAPPPSRFQARIWPGDLP